MLKNILNLEGTSLLEKQEQKMISGGAQWQNNGGVGGPSSCRDEADCHLAADNPLIPWACIGGSCVAGG